MNDDPEVNVACDREVPTRDTEPCFSGTKRINKYYFVARWSRRGVGEWMGSKVWGRKLHGCPIHQNEQEPHPRKGGVHGKGTPRTDTIRA